MHTQTQRHAITYTHEHTPPHTPTDQHTRTLKANAQLHPSELTDSYTPNCTQKHTEDATTGFASGPRFSIGRQVETQHFTKTVNMFLKSNNETF